VWVELVGFLVKVKDDVSGCDGVDIAGFERVGDEESASSLDRWGSFSADGETEGSGERLSGLGGAVVGGAGLVHLRTSGTDDHRPANFDMDVNFVSERMLIQ